MPLFSVGRDGIEPPTHGFSVHCSTVKYKELELSDYLFGYLLRDF